jgi:hypothetical protein
MSRLRKHYKNRVIEATASPLPGGYIEIVTSKDLSDHIQGTAIVKQARLLGVPQTPWPQIAPRPCLAERSKLVFPGSAGALERRATKKSSSETISST